MNSFISGKFLTSRMFIATSLLVFAVYLFSLAILKKQTGLHVEEISELDVLKFEIIEKPDEMKVLFDKIKFFPAEYKRLSETKNMASIEIADRKIIDDPEYNMFVWIKYKTWLDLNQANLPVSGREIQVSKKDLLSYLNSDLSQRDAKAMLLEQVRFKFYSDLIHKSDRRDLTILDSLKLVGPMAAISPQASVYFLEDIVNLTDELLAQKMLNASDAFVTKPELRMFKIFHFLLQVDPVIGFTEDADLDWFPTSSLYCAYYYDHYKLYQFLMPLDQRIGLSKESTKENFFLSLTEHAKACGKTLKYKDIDVWVADLEKSFKLMAPAGAWDLNAKYKNQNKILSLLRLELSRRIKLQK